MKNIIGRIKELWRNKWIRFGTVSIIYILLCVVWTGNPWMLLGLLVIYDIYISKVFYRLVWKKHKDHKKKSRAYKKTMEWVEAIVFAVVVTSLIKIFIFAFYVIPTPSMEKSLLVGDYLCVSKIAYGPVVPNTPLSFPLVHNLMPFSNTQKSYSEAIQWNYHRLKGFKKVKRGDVVVFNFPAGDTVLLERPEVTYYDIERDYRQNYGDREGRERLFRDYTVAARPVDKRDNYVKRAVGLPGDTIRIRNSELTVNGNRLHGDYKIQYVYLVQTNGTPINQNAFEEMGMSSSDISYNQMSRTYAIPLTDENAERVGKMRNVTEVTKYVAQGASPYIFPHNREYLWNEDNFGPLWVPSKGSNIELTFDNLPLYRTIIEKYEGNELKVDESTIYINGLPATDYTFRMDYYFMMGDNRHNSADSRFWGFVPEDHIVGKASFVWLSLNQEKRFPANIRWGRMFRGIK